MDMHKNRILDMQNEIEAEVMEYDMAIRMTCLKLACEYCNLDIVNMAEEFYNFIINNKEIENEET